MNKQHIFKIAGILVLGLALAFLISEMQLQAVGAVLGLLLGVGFVILNFKFEKLSLYAVLLLSFILPILGRYFPSAIPYGLSIDVLLILGLGTVFVKHYKNIDLSRLKHPMFFALLLWMIYIIFEIFNPLAPSFSAWFYSMRGIALYQLLIVMLMFLTFDRKELKPFFFLWLAFSILGVLWGAKQLFLGVSVAEQRWLNEGGAVTHMLFGKLRIFSYYFDAGTFGAAMGHLSLICVVLGVSKFVNAKQRIALFVLGAIFFYGLMISGTRGALAVPAAGAFMYLILSKNIKVLIPGIVVLFLAFSFLKYTSIGQSNYEIQRLRSALDPNDASLKVRIMNRERLSVYLSDKPFGGGMGSTGSWGRRFSPNTWLSEFEPDGLYTRVRAEAGIVGRNLYVGILLFLLVIGARHIFKSKASLRKAFAMAFLSGYAGILLASYGNSVLSQFPISTTTFMSLFFVFYISKEDESQLLDQAVATEEVN